MIVPMEPTKQWTCDSFCPTPSKVPLASIIALVIQRKLLPPLFLRTDPRKHSQRWRYAWRTTDEFGKHNSHTVSSDSYAVDVYRAVAEPGSRHLISPQEMWMKL
jgi:hypothetical protein